MEFGFKGTPFDSFAFVVRLMAKEWDISTATWAFIRLMTDYPVSGNARSKNITAPTQRRL